MKNIVILVAFSFLFFAGTSHAKMQEMVKEAGDLTVKISMEMEKHNMTGNHEAKESEHHHAMGKNKMNISVLDNDAKPITDAKIKVGYSMQPMGDMPPMKYTSRAKLHDDKYEAKMNFSMKGEWDVMIYIKRKGHPLAKVDFDVHVK